MTQVRCYELSQLSLKFERHLDSEIVDFEVSLPSAIALLPLLLIHLQMLHILLCSKAPEAFDFVQILSDDYSKVAFLCADRSINLHAKFGAYYKIRIPRFGRDLAYHPYNADLLIAGSSNEIFRSARTQPIAVLQRRNLRQVSDSCLQPYYQNCLALRHTLISFAKQMPRPN